MKYIVLLIITFELFNYSYATENQRIITAASANLRPSPTARNIIKGLPLGTIATELNTKVSRNSVWHKIKLTNGKVGWLHGSLSMAFSIEDSLDIYRSIVNERIAYKSPSFGDLIELENLLNSIQFEKPKLTAEFKLIKLQLLSKFITFLNKTPKRLRVEPYRTWVKNHKHIQIFYDESRGIWMVDAMVYWDLHQEFYPLNFSDNIAWLATKIKLGGECEGFLTCNLNRLLEKEVKYIKYHPTGEYVGKILTEISQQLSNNSDSVIYIDEKNEFIRQYDILRAIIKTTNHQNKPKVMQQLKQLKHHVFTKLKKNIE
jgi:hypothetical protein